MNMKHLIYIFLAGLILLVVGYGELKYENIGSR